MVDGLTGLQIIQNVRGLAPVVFNTEQDNAIIHCKYLKNSSIILKEKLRNDGQTYPLMLSKGMGYCNQKLQSHISCVFLTDQQTVENFAKGKTENTVCAIQR